MNATEFHNCTLSELENLTSVSRFRWSKYFNGRISMREDILCRTAKELNMTPVVLFEVLRARRDFTNLNTTIADSGNK